MEKVEEKTVPATKVSAEVPSKLSYEELEKVAHQLSDQARSLYQRVQELENVSVLNRLNFLFKVVEYKEAFEDMFVKTCLSEIVDLMTIRTDTEEE